VALPGKSAADEGVVNRWHILTSEYPPDIGGVSEYTRHVAEALVTAGDDVHVWCPHHPSEIASSGVHVHGDMGGIRPSDLRRLDRHLNEYDAPRRLLVQWVPHGFGYRSMNVGFCLWLASRAWRGDHVQLMVHEPYIEFSGPLRHRAMAAVHRLMTVVLLAASRQVWMSIPAWEARLRPYALGRTLRMQWLPVPGSAEDATAPLPMLRREYASDWRPVIGHFGSYGRDVSSLLEERLAAILEHESMPSVLLIGAGGNAFRETLLSRNGGWASRVHATGFVAPADLGAVLGLCDLFVQPYPDGISSRRTSAMSCLAAGRAVVTTRGHLTEPLWEDSGAVRLADVRDVRSFVTMVAALLTNPEERRRLGDEGRHLYETRFTIERLVSTLRAA